ncbi:uncharacterized protein LOC143469667 isoform X1 [Clavelina lepadiformis]|uniref:uncharacterized protein LOC143469667 isoform X1 n=1 Tax=Clavelina lepadiformis TaxID=159417 RepID=UPI0040417C7B
MAENRAASRNCCDGYICTKAAWWKLAVLVGGCATFAIYADSLRYTSPPIKTYVLAAYIISWAISLLIFFAKLTGLSVHMNCPCLSFDTFDYFWSWLSSVNYVSSSVILACFYDQNCDPGCGGSGRFCSCAKLLTALLLGFLTAFLYILEAQNLRLYAPVGIGYGTSWRGMWKMLILVIGGVAFGFLVQTGLRCDSVKQGCTSARTFVLAVWCSAWAFSCLLYLLHVSSLVVKMSVNGQHIFGQIEFFWSALSCLLYLVGACVYAGFLGCTSFSSFRCRSRLAADICGFVAAILFAIDAYYLRNHRPVWFIRTTASSGGGAVTTRTTETRTVRSTS